MGDTFSSWQQEHSPDRASEWVCFDRELLYAFEAASKEVARRQGQDKGMLDVSDALAKSELAVEELRQKVRDAQKLLVFESIGTKPWRDLLSKHPPEGAQRNTVTFIGLPMEFNPDTFIPAAIAASCVEPGISKEQAEWFCEKFPVSEVDRVFGAVLTCNVSGHERPFDDTGDPLAGAKRLTPQSS